METSDIEVCKVSTTPEIHEGENRQENFINNEHDDKDKKCSNLKQFNDKEMIQNEQIQENEYQMVNYTGCPNQLINDDNSIIVNDSLKQQKQQNDKINRTVIRNTKTTTKTTTTTSCNNDNKFQFRTPQQFIHRKSTSWKKSWKKQSKSRQKNNHNHHQNNHQQQQQQQQQQPQQQQQDGIENCCPQQNLKNHNNHHHQHHQHHNRNYYYHQMIANNHQKNKQQQQKNNNCKQQQQQQQQKNNNCKQQQQKNNNNCKQQQLHCNDKKTLFKRITQHTLSSAFSSLRSKFFLPPKRPRKEIIIPPTKFLLGGNISDPLNLNSLQDEASNSTTPNATPKQSPITTPPKVEVIIPPNINDPLHLLDPVDSTEYEKQLVSPMKRKSKHRHRKKRPKHNNNNNNNQTIVSGNICDISGISTASSSSSAPVTPSITSTTTATATTTITTTANCSGVEDFVNFNESNVEHIKSSDHSGNVSDEDNIPSKIAKIDESGDGGENKFIAQTGNNENSEQIVTSSNKKECEDSSNKWNNSEREKIKRDLRLNLTLANAHQQQQQQHNQVHSANGNFNSNMGNSGGGGGGGRKRKISEGPNSVKNKSRRLDSLDKIVSPVVPQPGAWKRPPRTIPSGGRKNSRVRSTSASENELISPTEEIKTIESESTRVDTPDIENNKQIGDFTSVSSSSDQQNKITEEKQQDNQDFQQQQQQQEDEQEKEQSVTVDVPKKFKPENAKYQYGNYDNYGYRRNLNEFSDVRLQVFKRHPDLFRGKDILDIGCNSGHMTISVAQKLAPKSILGIDIDSKLIEKARKNLSLYVRIPKDVDYNNHHSKYHHRHHHHHHDHHDHHEKCQEHQHQQQQQQQNQIKEEKDQKTDQAEQQQEQQQQQQSSDIDCLPSSSSSKENPFPTLPASSIPLSSFEQSFSSLLNSKKKKKKRRSKITFASKYEVNRNELFPISFPICYGGIPDLNRIYENHQSTGCNCNCGCSGKDEKTTATATTTTVKKSKQFKNEFPNNVFFRVTNYVLPDETLLSNDTQQYDLIICLSVTKWIHLNFGDVGLKLAFKRMFNQLRPGGKLILEAQNWASYKKRKNLTEKICENYKNMEFFPDDFHEYLLSNEVGFSHAYTLDVPRHKSKGFSRPIQLYAKGDFTPSHIRWSDNYHPQITPYEAYRGIYAACPHAPQHPPWNYDTTPHGNGGNFNCLQTPMYQPTSQYYNPLETDTYLPSYDTEVLNRHYVFASPLYQTVWSPPASLRNSSSHTPLFGSVREYDIDDSGGGGSGSGGGNGVGSNNNGHSKHVYPPSYDEGNSPQVNSGGAFNSIREVDPIDENCSNNSNRRHVYALATSTNYVENNPSSSPHPLPTSSSSTSSSHQHQQMFDNTVTSSSSETIDCSNSTTTITTPITTNQSDFTDQHHHQHDSSSN